jgi:hypothetical protein
MVARNTKKVEKNKVPKALVEAYNGCKLSTDDVIILQSTSRPSTTSANERQRNGAFEKIFCNNNVILIISVKNRCFFPVAVSVAAA